MSDASQMTAAQALIALRPRLDALELLLLALAAEARPGFGERWQKGPFWPGEPPAAPATDAPIAAQVEHTWILLRQAALLELVSRLAVVIAPPSNDRPS